jgi:hypothetical protein
MYNEFMYKRNKHYIKEEHQLSNWKDKVPISLQTKYEIYNFNHAVEVLSEAYPVEYAEVIGALEEFSLSKSDIVKGGGNESVIPKKISSYMRPLDWKEIRITGDLIVKLHHKKSSKAFIRDENITIEDFIDCHNIDYVKNRVAVEVEWNSKDQTFDRDLYAFRTFYECGIISCGIIITRSEQLNTAFGSLGVKAKYGASTTWIGKLIPRINSGRNGGCPLMVVGITPKVIIDMEVV